MYSFAIDFTAETNHDQEMVNTFSNASENERENSLDNPLRINPDDIVSVTHTIKLRDGTVLNLEGLPDDGFNLLENAIMGNNLFTPSPYHGNFDSLDFDSIIEEVVDGDHIA